jgi:ribosomal protein S18 acetylase RimI-like enzyme
MGAEAAGFAPDVGGRGAKRSALGGAPLTRDAARPRATGARSEVSMSSAKKAVKGDPARDVKIRPASAEDIPGIVELDEVATGRAKPEYWRQLYEHFSREHVERHAFLVATIDARVVGFITGEIRPFEFGAEICGWVFALNVDPQMRVHNVGTRLFDDICKIFARAGVAKVRTLIERDNHLVMAFFRSQGMMVGRFIGMEKDID